MIMLPLKGKPVLHAMTATPPPLLHGKAQFSPLAGCEKDSASVSKGMKRCLQCQEDSLPLLATLHHNGGRIYCAGCFLVAIQALEEVQSAKKAGRVPAWVRRDIREAGMPAQWSEDWRTFHAHGLELLLMSGRFTPEMITGSGVLQVDSRFGSIPEGLPWRFSVVSYLLAGVGTEILLKGLYTLKGFSLRKPLRGKSQVVAHLNSHESRWNSPRESISFSSLLRVENLKRVCSEPLNFTFLGVAQEWRNDAAHVPLTSSGDFGIHLLKLVILIRIMHKEFMDAADEDHRMQVDLIMRTCLPIWRGWVEENECPCLQGL